MPPKRTSTSAAPAMTQAAIRKLVADSVTAALEAQTATMTSTDNLNRNIGPRETPVAKKRKLQRVHKLSTFLLQCGGHQHSPRLMEQIIKRGSMQGTSDHKLKFDDRRNSNNNNNYPNNRSNKYQNNLNKNSNRNNDYRQHHNKRQESFRSYVATLTENNGYTRNRPLCKKCSLHHTRPCTVKCNTCNKVGLLTRHYKNKGPATESNRKYILVICHACGGKVHYANQCPKINNNAHGRTYLLRDKNIHQDPNVNTGMFLLNQHLVRLLFDSGEDKSFVSISLASVLNIPPIKLDTTYDIEMANGNLSAVFSQLPYSDIEDAFSSNFSDYIPSSPDYVPASPRKTLSESSNNSSGLVPIASPTLSLFHDDPYMKVMHAYCAKESHIPLPVIVPPSSML
uniref:Reverse transcriptase domain-containing protein n=1 Tax=Tanacetum cinerariifolium TaxID=118510 RepID=A0A6L2KB71_TANCI|nr:hypothetical protein [Tanacetum cinerariifolium]